MVLLLLLAAVSVAGTFLPQGKSPAEYEQLLGVGASRPVIFLGLSDMYHSPWFRLLLLVLSLNMVACMLSRVPAMISSFRGEAALRRGPILSLPAGEGTEESLASGLKRLGFRERKSELGRVFSRGAYGLWFTVLSHLSILVIMGFSVAGSSLGFIGTQRVFVGDSTDTFFNWKTMSDENLPFRLVAEEFTRVPHPVALQLGVKETGTGRKGKLITTHVGASIRVPGLEGRVEVLDFVQETRTLSARWVRADGTSLEFTAGDEIGATGLALVPVAFALFPEKQVVARTSLVVDGAVTAAADIAVNHPLRHDGVDIYLTDYGTDPYGLPYVGYQIVSDPGKTGVWVGCVIFLIAVTGAIFVRHRCAVVVRHRDAVSVHFSSRGSVAREREGLVRALEDLGKGDGDAD